MRVCIFGAGAVGSHIAVKLANAGMDVSIIARGAHLDAIRTRGLTLLQAEKSWTVNPTACEDPSELAPQDIVFVTLKATGLAAIADKLKPLLSPQTAVVFVQNGIPWWYPVGLHDKPAAPDLPLFKQADAFLADLSPTQIIGGSIYSANAVVEPGVVRNNSPQQNRLSMGGITAQCTIDMDALRATLEKAGIAAPPPTGDIRELIWYKLLVNMSGSAIALATGNKSSISRQDPELETIYRRIMAEGLQIAAAHGFPIDHLLNVDDVLTRIPDHKPSLLQDYELRRPMEIGEIVRAPHAFARAAGLETPSLDVLCAIVTRMARDRGLYG